MDTTMTNTATANPTDDDAAGATNGSAVCSYNEWDPLEEVVVGIVDGAHFPAWNVINRVTVPPGSWEDIEQLVGTGRIPYPPPPRSSSRPPMPSLMSSFTY